MGRNVAAKALEAADDVSSDVPPELAACAGIRITKIVWSQGQVRLQGHAHSQVSFQFEGETATYVQNGAFDLAVAQPRADAALRVVSGEFTSLISAPRIIPKTRIKIYVIANLLTKLWTERTNLIAFLRHGDASAAQALRESFGFADDLEVNAVIGPGFFSADWPQDLPSASVAILLPVFNAAPETKTVLTAIEGELSDLHRLIIIDDASDDSEIAPLLADFVARNMHAELITQPRNQGFVAAVNRGLQASGDAHVILLNSDTLPPDGWVERLLAPILKDPNVASVTPFSNNAEILSIPAPGIETSPDIQFVTAMDKVAATLRPSVNNLPTGIGFCMALNRRFLDRIGSFDPEFGRGYGEEVDWCQRALENGGRHGVATNLFVGHQGGASFGSAQKTARIQTATKVINQRYPGYEHDVRRWGLTNPLGGEKLALALAWLGHRNTARVTIFLGHAMGGGAEAALNREIDGELKAGALGTVVLRAGGRHAWSITLYGQCFRLKCDVQDFDTTMRLLAPIKSRRVVYSCGVGAPKPTDVPRALITLAGQTQSLEIRMHDFFPISPSWNLLNRSGWYQGVPPLSTKDKAHRLPGVSHREWRGLWEQVFARADVVTVFSPSGRDIVKAAYPTAAKKITLLSHEVPSHPPVLRRGGKTIGVLGGINRAKGGYVLEKLSQTVDRKIAIIGELDGVFRLQPPHIVHGKYTHDQIAKLARYYDVGFWLIPSICPETFSFATHEALATGLPVIGFDLGAQGDALRSAPNGFVLRSRPEDWQSVGQELCEWADQFETKRQMAS
jgi:GT2 family glycosyltransferase